MSLLVFFAGSGPKLTDTGVTISDSLSATTRRPVAVTQTGVTITDSLVKSTPGAHTSRTMTDTGLTTGDAITVGTRSRLVTDTYIDGPSATLGSATLSTLVYSLFTDPFETYVAPDNETENYYARLPLEEAQTVFGSTATVAGTTETVSCSWHGMVTDPERGSFILVRVGSDLEDRIGSRIRVVNTATGATVYGWVHGVADLDSTDDLSLPRRLFMVLALPGLDRIDVVVDTLKDAVAA